MPPVGPCLEAASSSPASAWSARAYFRLCPPRRASRPSPPAPPPPRGGLHL